jgi:tetratricopeptide (TPR) repeat protein
MWSPDALLGTFASRRVNHRHVLATAVIAASALVFPLTANATFPAWLQHIAGASTIESALYRAMQLPAVQALYPRPPKEAATELSKLITASPTKADLYQLRARADEAALDETAAESDWKLYVAHATDPIAARLELADFYQRRLMVPQEIAILHEVATAPPIPAETYLAPNKQRSWLAFERILGTIDQQGLPPAQTASTFQAFLKRYPEQPAVYAAFLQFQIEQKDWPGAQSLIDRYRKQFPTDDIFPIRAQALLEYRRGNIDAALAVYDRAFQPLWPSELVQSYFALLDQTHRQRAFVAAARAQLAAHPDGPDALNALARIFDYEQQSGQPSSAQQTLDAFRIARDNRNGAWTPNDLYTLATLSLTIHSYSEAARYDYALASSDGVLPTGEPAAQTGLEGLIKILLEAPEQPLAIGAQNLTLYRDIATLDQGPGYWNGILSLWLNGERPESEYQTETSRAQSYFHRSKAAELLAELDRRSPAAPDRPALHAALIRTLSQYGEPATVISAGKQYLASFPSAPERLEVASLMADAYARENDTSDEFALYESQLNELGAKTGGLPLTSAATAPPPSTPPGTVSFYVQVQDPDSVDSDAGAARKLKSQPLAQVPVRRSLPAGTAYTSVLDRYLGRLSATGQLPRALTVLRTQLDRNPNDPLLYERLATFFQQNNLSAQEEQIYQQAIARFQEPSRYDQLARLYLREKKRQAFGDLTRKVTDIFSGTDLDHFFSNVNPSAPIGPQLALQLNLYAAKRFPHDLVFTRNLLRAYRTTGTRDNAAYEALLRQQWWESDDLRDEFLAYLSRTGKLQAELAQLEALNSDTSAQPSTTNAAALREQGEIEIFTSHFEQAAPLLGAVANLYPADADTGEQAVSLYRSLAYLDPQPGSTLRAVALENNLLAAAPDSPDRLATLGDLYAEATSNGGEDLIAAAPYWRRIPTLHPGSTQGFLTSSTIFWDYFQFDDALAEITTARSRFHSPALFGYEAGAIEENRHNLPAAVAEYTNAVIHPIAIPRHFDSSLGVIDAWLKPPSDAGDSNFRSTTQSFFGPEEANARLIQLATRAGTRDAVEGATARAVADNPANTAALSLRANVLAAQHHEPELTPLLTALFNQALDRTSTQEEAAAVGTLAQGRSLTAVYERALTKQAALTLDPVQKIELQYSLARSLESHDDIAGATRVIESVHAASPNILGVVRATTDFYVRTNQSERAVSTLLSAAKAATPKLARDFTLEAASRANDAGDTAQARTLAMTLLADTPYDARVLDIIATSYARAHDDPGLKQFYLSQLDTARQAPGLSADERKQDIALLRRGLVPALTRLKDYPSATDQYIALLSAFPEDASLSQEADLYALKHDRQSQLLDFLRITVKQSPRDARFMVLLASAEEAFGDLPAAEAAYSLAISLRKDRVDLYTARADMETRLSQTDPAQSELAAADFERLYLLTYHDPSWMVRLAQLRARQQRPADAVKALEAAYINGHAKAAPDYFTVAAQLERWDLLAKASSFAEQGVTLAGDDLLTPAPAETYPQPQSGAVVYARILARSGQADRALATLTKARRAAEVSATSPSVLAAELARENLSDDEAAGFRQNFAARRRQSADQNLAAAVEALGRAVQAYYTPEQKQAFALTLDKLHDAAQPNANPDLALQAATAAGLADREAEWRKQGLPTEDRGSEQLSLYVALQQRRLQFSALAHDLEAHAARLLAGRRKDILTQAAQAYRDTGDSTNEARLTRTLITGGESQLRTRYLDLLLRHDPTALTRLAASRDTELADAALNYTIAHGSELQALTAVASRGQTLDPVWRPASASLVRTYFAGPNATTEGLDDFESSLATDATIGDRIGARPDPARQLTGDIFFYYASRFGIFLGTVPHKPDAGHTAPDAEDFLAAELEGSPSSPTPYLNLARTYAEAHRIPDAVSEYDHALELSPSDPAIEDELATALYRANRHAEALTHWHRSLAILSRMQQHALYPESWFTSLETTTRHLGDFHQAAAFRPELESIIGPYLAKNRNYRSNELLKAIYKSSGTSAEGADFILTVANEAPDPNQILDDLNHDPWLTDESRETILLRQIELVHADPLRNAGSRGVSDYQAQLVELYLAQNRLTRAQAMEDSLSGKERKRDIDKVDIILAIRTGRLQALLDKWHANPDAVPRSSLSPAVSSLLKATPAYKPDPPAIRPLQEFIFEDKRQNAQLVPADFLALAQLRLDTGDLPGTLDLLQQLSLQKVSSTEAGMTGFPSSEQSEFQLYAPAMTTVDTNSSMSDPSINTDLAASFLEKNHHPTQAVPFLQSLVKSVPWDASYRLRLAQAQLASNAREEGRANLTAVASDASALYTLRVQAARELAPFGSPSPDLGSAELQFLAHPSTTAAARQPYFAEARITAAEIASTPGPDRELLLREAIAISPNGTNSNRARLKLLLLQPDTADPSATLAILRSIQTAPPPNPYAAVDAEASNTGVDSATDNASTQNPEDANEPVREAAIDSPDNITVTIAALPPGADDLDLPTRIRLATWTASAYERDGSLESALAYMDLAVDLAKPSPPASVAHHRDDLKRTILLDRRNALRRPDLHKALEQSTQVRPRLTASTPGQEDNR